MSNDNFITIAKEIRTAAKDLEIEIEKTALSIVSLEKQYNKIKRDLGTKNATSLPIKDLRTLLAYEYLKDGANADFIEEVLKSNDKTYTTKIQLLKQLEVFGY